MTISLRISACAVATVIVLTGTSPANPASATPRANEVDGPSYQAPVVGGCHSYGIATAYSPYDTSPAISCRRVHTAKVIALFMLPDDVAWPQTQAEVDAFYDEMYGGVLRPCATAFRKELGARYKRLNKTAYDWTFYRPTPTQQAHGARWIRCDVNLLGGRRLQRLPAGRVRLGNVTENERACRLSAGKGWTYLTGCTLPHHFRAVKVVRARFTTYGARSQWVRLAKRTCSSGGPNWYATWRSPADWADGNHFLTCWTRTRR